MKLIIPVLISNNSIVIHMQRLHAGLEARETQSRAKEEEMKQRDAEINRLLGELRRCQELLRQVSFCAG